MTDTKISLDFATIQKLFAEGVCLTYNPDINDSTMPRVLDLEYDFRKKNNGALCRIEPKIAKLWPDSYNTCFHYFSQGVLIHNLHPTPENELKLQNIKRALQIRGYPIKQIFGPASSKEFFYYEGILQEIRNFSQIHYAGMEEFKAVPFPPKKTFVDECFANNNILLTACKEENIDPQYRKYFALFADGSFYISEKFRVSGGRLYPSWIWINFKNDNPKYVYFNPITVPQDYLEALYERARSQEGYLSTNNYQTPQPSWTQSMDEYITDILSNRYCVSVTEPIFDFNGMLKSISPDGQKFVLFSDGTLVLAEEVFEHFNKKPTPMLQEHLEQAFPGMVFKPQSVPAYYIAEIYKRLLSVQKSAKSIYLELLKQKAKKLKKMLQIPHHEALELCAKISGSNKWTDLCNLEEYEYRHLITLEKTTKMKAEKQNKDMLEEAYKNYLKELKK